MDRTSYRYAPKPDALNAMNRSQFAAPDMNPLSSNFGKSTTKTPAINRVVTDSDPSGVLDEHLSEDLPYADRIRDFVSSVS
jgi:hypothetical protein